MRLSKGFQLKKMVFTLIAHLVEGGHSRKILENLGSDGRLIAMDKDQAAMQAANKINDKRFEIVNSSFSKLGEVLKKKVFKSLMEY